VSDLAPDVSVAPDTGLGAGEPAPTQAVDASPQAVAPDVAADVDPWDDPSTDTFPRSYVEQLRQEAAERRTSLQPYRDAFDGYEDSDRDTLLAFAQTLRQDPTTAAQWMATQAEAILDGDGEGEGYDESAGDMGDQGDGLDEDTPLTRGQLEQFLAQRDAQTQAQQQHESQIASIIDEAKELGYDPESPEGSADYVALLHVANTQTGYDLNKAHEIMQGRNQKVIDGFLASKRGDADGSAITPQQTGSSRQENAMPEGWGDDFRSYIRGMAGSS